jgi:hypothetical protein
MKWAELNGEGFSVERGVHGVARQGVVVGESKDFARRQAPAGAAEGDARGSVTAEVRPGVAGKTLNV